MASTFVAAGRRSTTGAAAIAAVATIVATAAIRQIERGIADSPGDSVAQLPTAPGTGT